MRPPVTQAMLLAAGLGTRLWPLTEDRAKPAVPFLGRPLIAGLARWLAGAGVTRVVVNTHHLPASIHAALADGPPDLEISFSHEDVIQGTAGALSLAAARGLLDPAAPLLLVNAKLYVDLDLARVLCLHRESAAAVSMVLRPNPRREEFREVFVQGGLVRGFGPGRAPVSAAPLLFTGIHLLEPEVLAAIPRGVSDTVADVYPPLIRQGRVQAIEAGDGRWWEFSTLERYLELHREAARLGLGPSVTCSPGARVAPDAAVADAVLWEGAEIGAGARVERAILGRGARVPPGEALFDAVLVPAGPLGEAARGEPIFGDQLKVPLTRS